MAYPLASQFMKRLQELIDEHGDRPIVVLDADTGWDLVPGIVLESSPFHRFEITSDYDQDPEGKINN